MHLNIQIFLHIIKAGFISTKSVLKIVDEYEKDYIVNNFHGRVRNKTFKQVVNFHTSYHLNQFGVL